MAGHSPLDRPPVPETGDVGSVRQKEAHRHVEHERVFAQQVDAAEAEHLNRFRKPGKSTSLFNSVDFY